MNLLKTKTDLRAFFHMLFCILFGVALIYYSYIPQVAIKNSLTLCISVILPSLFPFMIISCFLCKTHAYKLFGPSLSVILMSLIGGYPIGPKIIYEMYEDEAITVNKAKRLMLCSVNAGPAFVVNAVGSILMGNVKSGIILFSSCALSSIILACICIIPDKEKKRKAQIKTEPLMSSLTDSVSNACHAMIDICSIIIAFSCILEFLRMLIKSDRILSLICLFSEITTGINETYDYMSLPVLAFFLAFGGICVHCQIIGYINHIGLDLKLFYFSRILHGALSCGICSILLNFFPTGIETIAFQSSFTNVAFSLPFPTMAAMFFMIAVLIFDLDCNKKVC